MINAIIQFFGYVWACINTLLLSYFYSIFITSPFVVIYTATISFSSLNHPAWIADKLWLALILVYVPVALIIAIQAAVTVLRARFRVAKKMKENK